MKFDFTRRSFLRTTALGSAALALGTAAKGQPAKLPRKPNLLIFLPDQQRPDTIACYGGPTNYAPNLSKFATQSTVFHQVYVTHPVCTSSRSSLMTGTWPHENHCTQNWAELDPKFLCFPELMSDRDYRCAYMGKWHLGDELNMQHGFSEWVSIMDEFHKTFNKVRDPNAISDYSKFLFEKGLKPAGQQQRFFGKKFITKLPIELGRPKFLEIKACDFLERHKNDPFVLFVMFLEPHPPYSGPLNEEHPLTEKDLDPAANHIFGADMPLRYRMRQQWDAERFGKSTHDYLKVKQRYLGLVTQVDRSIGAILEKLETLGLADNTIVIHTSDHGDMMGAHRLFEKCVMFEEAVRVPYLVRMPNQRRTASISQPISHIDLVPTFLDLLGQKPHEQCVGKSRVPLLRGESMPPQTVFIEWAPDFYGKNPKAHGLGTPEEIKRAANETTRTAITPEGWKICLRDVDKNELYNLRADPREMQNLYGRTNQKEMIAKLTGEIHQWQGRAGDTIKV